MTAPPDSGQGANPVRDRIEEHVRYLARVSDELDVADPVGERISTVVGQWAQLHAAAERWRRSADVAEEATRDVSAKLGGIDLAWRGADADAFLTHVHEIGLAGNHVVDAMREWADAVDRTADALHAVADRFADLVGTAAENVSEAMAETDAPERARRLLLDADDPARELVESAEDVVRAFVRLCDEFDAGRGASAQAPNRASARSGHGTPAPQPASAPQEGASASAAAVASTGGGTPAVGGADGVSPVDAGGSGSRLAEGGSSSAEEPSEAPAPAAAAGTGHGGGATAAAAGGGATGGGMVGAMPMAGMMGRNHQNERRNSSRLKASPEELFGKPDHTAPAVFGAAQKKPTRDT